MYYSDGPRAGSPPTPECYLIPLSNSYVVHSVSDAADAGSDSFVPSASSRSILCFFFCAPPLPPAAPCAYNSKSGVFWVLHNLQSRSPRLQIVEYPKLPAFTRFYFYTISQIHYRDIISVKYTQKLIFQKYHCDHLSVSNLH